MVQVDIPFAFGVGSLFATAVSKGLSSPRADYFYQRGLAANLVFQALLVIWLPLYLLVSHFGFQTSHMWWHGDSLGDHPWLVPAFMTLYFAATIAGYRVGASLVTRGRVRAAWGIFFVTFAFFFGWIAAQPRRTLTFGTYREWQAGTAPWIWTDPSFVTLLVGDFLFFFAVLWPVYRVLQREAAGAAAGRGVSPATVTRR